LYNKVLIVSDCVSDIHEDLKILCVLDIHLALAVHPFILCLFALTPLASLHQFLTCGLVLSIIPFGCVHNISICDRIIIFFINANFSGMQLGNKTRAAFTLDSVQHAA